MTNAPTRSVEEIAAGLLCEKISAAMQELVEACGHVAPLTGHLEAGTVRDLKKAMRFMAAVKRAKAALAEVRAHHLKQGDGA